MSPSLGVIIFPVVICILLLLFSSNEKVMCAIQMGVAPHNAGMPGNKYF